MKLFGYWRSSAAYRVRIVLNLKELDYENIPVNLAKGEQKSADHLARQPQGSVPVLELDDGTLLTQSIAVCEYLDESHPEPPLLPRGPVERARVRALAQVIASDMHPVNNLRLLKYLTGTLGHSEDEKLAWYRHWIAEGFQALERMLDTPATGTFCHGDSPTLADVCLVPQLYNARRFECDLSPYPRLVEIANACESLPAFAEAHPARQPDAPR